MPYQRPKRTNGIYWKVMDECNRLMAQDTPCLPKSEKRKRLPKRRPSLPRTDKTKPEK